MKFVVFADPHLSDIGNTVQEAALDSALRKARALSPDAILCAGDVTACGSCEAAIRFTEKLRALPFPALTVPGNSDLRCADTAPLLSRLFSAYPDGLPIGDIRLVGMDLSRDTILPEERVRLSRLTGNEKLILLSHQGHAYLDGDSRAFLSEWIGERKDRILLWLTGHAHVMRECVFAGVRELSLRALDPDKCIGGLPQLLVLETDGGSVSVTGHDLPDGQLGEWTKEEKDELLGLLGVTCYDPEKDMEQVLSLGIRHLEWRSVSEKTLPLLRRWRETVKDTTFSLHMPSLGYDGAVRGAETLASAAKAAVDAGADMITVHPPQTAIGLMEKSGAFEALADAMANALRPAAEAGIRILVENNHTPFGTSSDVSLRGFGCTPAEVLTWKYALCERLGKETCGLRLDVGHARNNLPVSMEYPLGKWYALIGPHARAYHLHQTVMDPDGRMHNHHPITGLCGGTVAFCGFLHQWHAGVLTHGPVILEIREGEGAIGTYKRLVRLINEE